MVITELGGEVEPDNRISQQTSVNSTTSSIFTGERVNRLVKNLRLPFGGSVSSSSSNSVSISVSGSVKTNTPSSPATTSMNATQHNIQHMQGLHERLIVDDGKPRESMGFNSSFNVVEDNNVTETQSGKQYGHSFDVESANPLHE